jgi:hypothetical protein
MARAKLNKPPGLFTRVNWEVAQPIKKLASEMNVSAAALVNAILAKALANSGASDDGSGKESSGNQDGAQ